MLCTERKHYDLGLLRRVKRGPAFQSSRRGTHPGRVKMFCLAGIGGHLSGFIQSAKDVLQIVAIDGCPVGCARATLEHAEISIKRYLVLTDLGIEKNKDFKLRKEEVQKVKEAIKEACAREQDIILPTAQISSNGCCG